MPPRRRNNRHPGYDRNALLQKSNLLIDEAAFLLGMSKRSVQRYMTDGILAFRTTPGRQRRPLTESVRKFL